MFVFFVNCFLLTPFTNFEQNIYIYLKYQGWETLIAEDMEKRWTVRSERFNKRRRSKF